MLFPRSALTVPALVDWKLRAGVSSGATINSEHASSFDAWQSNTRSGDQKAVRGVSIFQNATVQEREMTSAAAAATTAQQEMKR